MDKKTLTIAAGLGAILAGCGGGGGSGGSATVLSGAVTLTSSNAQ